MIAWLVRLFWGLLALGLFLLAALAVNQEPIALKFLNWQSPQVSVFWWLLGAFGLGLGLGLLGTLVANTRLRLLNRRLGKELTRAEKALDNA